MTFDPIQPLDWKETLTKTVQARWWLKSSMLLVWLEFHLHMNTLNVKSEYQLQISIWLAKRSICVSGFPRPKRVQCRITPCTGWRNFTYLVQPYLRRPRTQRSRPKLKVNPGRNPEEAAWRTVHFPHTCSKGRGGGGDDDGILQHRLFVFSPAGKKIRWCTGPGLLGMWPPYRSQDSIFNPWRTPDVFWRRSLSEVFEMDSGWLSFTTTYVHWISRRRRRRSSRNWIPIPSRKREQDSSTATSKVTCRTKQVFETRFLAHGASVAGRGNRSGAARPYLVHRR